jgi:signal transduction histidine kinase
LELGGSTRIFDEHSPAGEAVYHNRESTRLGLAIMRHVAQTNGVRVRVETRHGAGNKIHTVAPIQPVRTGTATDAEEMFNGPLDDS